MRKPARLTRCLLLGAVAFAAARSEAGAQRKPNILVIVGDDMGYGDIGIHGARDLATPHIDALAQAGVRCASGYVSGPYCSPTRAGLMTGRYQQRYGHEFNPGAASQADKTFGLPLTEHTLVERLRDAGYVTGMVGKWHLGSEPQFHPLRRGFGSYFGFLGGAHSYLDARAEPANPILRGSEPVDESEYLTDAFRREALAFIDRNRRETWFLYLTFNAVHNPMHATRKYLDRFPQIADEQRRTYAAMMAAMDDAIGSVVARLAELRLDGDTLIFFISDNGGPTINGSSNAPLRGWKAQTWEGGIRVPFLVRWKGRLPAGTVYSQPVIQLDILPTALAAAGVELRREWKLDGVDLLPFLEGRAGGAPHAALYWRFAQHMAIRMGDWKLVRAAEGTTPELRRRTPADDEPTGARLFNLSSDIGEQSDLAQREPERVKTLAAAWKAWNRELQEPRWFGNRLQAPPPR